jgi:hypothetical protein
MPSQVVVDQPTEVWVQVCLPDSSGFVESLPQFTSAGEEIGKPDARRSPGSVQFIEREGHLLNAVLSVTVTSPHFEVVGETRAISLSPRHDSAKLVFQVIPTGVVARARVFVSVTQEQDGAPVTVAEVSVTARVLPSDERVPVPPSARLNWNVTQQGMAAGVPLRLGIMRPNRPASPIPEAKPASPVPEAEIGRIPEAPSLPAPSLPAPSLPVESLPAPPSRTASRRWFVLTAAVISFAVVAVVAWRLLG